MTDDELLVAILETAQELDDERFRHLARDIVVRRAGERIVEIIGDMVGQFSPEFQSAHPGIEFRGAYRMRNILAHHYMKVATDRVSEVIKRDIPQLVAQLEAIAATRQVEPERQPGDTHPNAPTSNHD